MRLYEIKTTTVYHVTHTDRLPSITKKGLLPMQTSNWLKAGDKERYGSGEIFVSTNKQDAIRWGAKMDWEFNKRMGSGKISLLTLDGSEQDWEVDDADPISQAGNRGQWLKSYGNISPDKIIKSEPLTPEMIKNSV